jgi:hypothetical protein
MQINEVDLCDYLSFLDCNAIRFAPGINLVVGINNSGKSAFLRALVPSEPATANRNENRFEIAQLPQPTVNLRLRISGTRLKDMALQLGGEIPKPSDTPSAEFLEKLFSADALPIHLVHRGGGLTSAPYPGHGMFDVASVDLRRMAPARMAVIVRNEGGNLESREEANDGDAIPRFVTQICAEDIYYFSAYRTRNWEYQYEKTNRLTPDASNLPAFLATLQGERMSVFRKIVDQLKIILPAVGDIACSPSGSTGRTEILVYPNLKVVPDGLTFPLRESGTGVGQVLAILSAVATKKKCVIIIDEINSFLHPAAVKALLRLFHTEYDHHQYIVSTHSAEVISVSNPSTVHLLRRDGCKTTIRTLDLKNVIELRDVARELGVSMTDVFSADSIVWVEGPSEEVCFPIVYQHATGSCPPQSTKLVAVKATGSFMRKKDKKLVFEIYERLCGAALPLVTSTRFSFDSENLKSEEREELKRQSGDAIQFLPRRHLECYFLHPQSIADFIASKELPEQERVSPNAVRVEMERLAGTQEFSLREWANSINDTAWQSKVNAARLIDQVCQNLTASRVCFDKVNDCPSLLKLVLKNDASRVIELQEYVTKIIYQHGS